MRASAARWDAALLQLYTAGLVRVVQASREDRQRQLLQRDGQESEPGGGGGTRAWGMGHGLGPFPSSLANSRSKVKSAREREKKASGETYMLREQGSIADEDAGIP